ncbi:arylsulfatase [Carboxylicivirga sp. A043]|uniref:sulfatase family protein n=1 Tax=Carboxylicivirga litoralis TaxID=2816963 RepID=UPI0021CB5CF8|nr:arylsulfatase [Carboxylicivirga sp. A043]MCU4155486.1 arylsulfatase [Carboxylicivirga sp. A043]
MNFKVLQFLILTVLLTSCQNKEPEQLPNIVYILADDMGYGDIKGLNPDSKIPTPHLDRLINEGMRFSDAHSNSALCTPTRYGTLTGRYCFRSRLKSGVLVGHEPGLIEDSISTVAHLLKQANYQTACVGKWHLGLNWSKKDVTQPLFHGGNLWDIQHTDNVDYMAPVSGGPCDVGFDYSFIIPASLDIAPYVYLENDIATAPVTQETPFFKDNKARGIWYRRGDVADDFDHTTVLQTITRKAINFIESADKEQPFFLYFPLTSPHTPWFPSKEFQGKSEAGVYGDFVAMTDDVVGQIMHSLKDQGLMDNTIVIFTSDNGSQWIPSDIETFNHLANGPFRGMKSDIWEGGHHIPFIIRWPEHIAPNCQSNELICSTDLLATCAELTGQSVPASAQDSYSFLSILTGDKTKLDKDRIMIHHSANGTFAIRKSKWKLIDAKGSGGWSLPENKCDKDALPQQLYNMEEDIEEQNNLYTQYPEIVKELNALLWEYKEGNEVR